MSLVYKSFGPSLNGVSEERNSSLDGTGYLRKARHIVYTGTGNFVDYRQVTDGYRSTSSSITARKDDFVIAVDASGAARTITLPAAAKYEGQVYVIKKTDSSVNTVTVDGDSSETIDGALTYVLAAQYQSVTVLCTGTGWLVL